MNLIASLKSRLRDWRMFATGGGPPDLEELWRDFNRKLSGMFGGRKVPGSGGSSSGGSGGSMPPEMPSGKMLGGGLTLVLVVVGLLWGSSGFFIVPEGQAAAILRFGKFQELTDRAGFKWRLPYPIEAHEIVNLQTLRQVEVGYRNNVKTKVLKESLILTDDENIIDIQFAVQFRIKDGKAWLFNNRDSGEIVLQAAETAMREIVGKSKMDFVLYEGKEQIAKDVEKLMQQIVDRYDSGIAVVNVTLQNVQPPEQVQAAFDDAVKAGQDRERAKNDGQAYANDVIPKARGTAARILQEAEGYKQKVVVSAEGEAARFKQVLAEYSKAPQVTRDRMYLETMQQVFANTSKVMVDARQGSQMLYLPLDKLIQQSGAPAVPDTPAPARVQIEPSAPTTVDTRGRDAGRGREREGR